MTLKTKIQNIIKDRIKYSKDGAYKELTNEILEVVIAELPKEVSIKSAEHKNKDFWAYDNGFNACLKQIKDKLK